MRPSDQEEWSLADLESDLVARMLAGDEMAFAQFADQYLPPLHRFAQRRVGDRELAREIVQSTVVKAISKLATFRGEAGLATWLCACCRNEIASHFRREGRKGTEVGLAVEGEEGGVELVSTESTPEQELLRTERRVQVHDTLDRLPPHYARALEWKYVAQLSVDEIAARLGLSTKAAESVLTRARVAFRGLFAGVVGGGGGEGGGGSAATNEATAATPHWAHARSR